MVIERGNSHYPGVVVGPLPIKYQIDPQNKNKCFDVKGSTVNVDLLHLGQSKCNYWRFEKEWRYKIIGMPFEGKWQIIDYDNFSIVPQNHFIDVRLDDSVIEEMVIQLGPKASLSETIIADLLVKEFAKGAKVCDSGVKINR